MKYWNGRDFEYRGYIVKIKKREGFLYVYDNRNNYLFRVESLGSSESSCISGVKFRIDRLIRIHG